MISEPRPARNVRTNTTLKGVKAIFRILHRLIIIVDFDKNVRCSNRDIVIP